MRARLPDRLVLAVPGDRNARTGGTIYDRKVADALAAMGWTLDWLPWAARFPFPNDADRAAASDSLDALPDGALVLIDGLAFGALPELARREADRLRLVALVHHPLALETGLSQADAAALMESERRALACTRAVIVTSQTTAGLLQQRFGVPASRITVAIPGVDPVPPRGPRAPGSPRIFAMGAVSPRKAHHILVEALCDIKDMDWSCVIAGNLERDPAAAAALRQQIDSLGLTSRIKLVGEISEQEAMAQYAQADIFALASLYEGYGMVFSEALAHGLPIVATTGGAIPEVVPQNAGLLVPPGDAKAFAQALRASLADPDRREAMAAAAGARQQDWGQTALRIATALRAV
jgi:glycosyltransferase involved in cell wall biosynthesis